MVGGFEIFDRSYMHAFSVEVALSITKVKKAGEIKQVAVADNILTEYCVYIYFFKSIGRLQHYHELVHVIYFCETVCQDLFFPVLKER